MPPLNNDRRRRGSVAIVSICLGVCTNAAFGQLDWRTHAASPTVHANMPDQPKKPAEIWGQLAEKVDTFILQTRDRVEEARAGAAKCDAGVYSIPPVVRVSSGGDIHCYVTLSTFTQENLETLAACGLRLEASSEEMKTAQGWIPVDCIDQIATLPFVRKIKPPDYAVTRCVGASCTEGDAIHAAQDLRQLGLNGAGVRVGVISDGVDDWASAVASMDLPVSIMICPSLPGSGDEGTAMLEIIHDIAPGATLLFAGPETSVEMVQAVNWLADQNVGVIVDDLGFFGEPFFADGPVAKAVQNAVARGIVFCSAAGNDCGYHYQGFYTGASSSTLPSVHDFEPGPAQQLDLRFFLFPQEWLIAYLQWDDPMGASGNDYDLRVFDYATGSFIYGFGGWEAQDGDDDPVEMVLFWNDGPSIRFYGLAVENYMGLASPRNIELFTWYVPFSDPLASCADSIFGHPGVPGVIACGAIDASDPGNRLIASYSSQGPSTISLPSPEVRQTPFCTAIDGVEVSGAGGFPSPFFGTSAAAPHAAGLVALLLNAAAPTDPSAISGQIRNALAAGAIDRGAAGFDNIFGHGLLNVPGACQALLVPASVQGSQGTGCTGVELSWSAAPGLAEHSVWRSTTRDFAAAAMLKKAVSSPWIDKFALPATTYYYWVQADYDWGISNRTGPCTGFAPNREPLAAPENVAVTQGTLPDAVRVSWDPVDGATSYTIWRSEGDTLAAPVTLLGEVAAPPFDDSTAQPGVSYYYFVRARDACGEAFSKQRHLGFRSVGSASLSPTPGACGTCGSGVGMAISCALVFAGAARRSRNRGSRREAHSEQDQDR